MSEQSRRVDRITRRFHDAFKGEHEAFLSSITGIASTEDRAWYASVLINRLIFVHFLKSQGSRDLEGGLFDEHELEVKYPHRVVPDEAVARLVGFFGQYQWHLDNRPLTNDRMLNPDVLGFMFEKRINQKQMGAYYTREDITEYIARSAIVPFLLEAVARTCPEHFGPDGSLWSLLRTDPDTYLFAAVRHGVDMPLPSHIAAGLDDVKYRADWNRPAAAEYALPAETWREFLERRLRGLDLRRRLRGGEIHTVNDLITWNLDVRRLVADWLRTRANSELVWSFWKALTKLSVLDPTCGSGAFLFASLNVLEPLYHACLERMAELLGAAAASSTNFADDFREVLERSRSHANRNYFVVKSILINNLHGVDVMREAVEVCKQRLCLKLLAQVPPGDPLGPLPDLDFNIRAGNTLVGYVTISEVKRSLLAWADGGEKHIETLRTELVLADAAMQAFRRVQLAPQRTAADHDHARDCVRQRLQNLRGLLDECIAREHGVVSDRTEQQPFHWVGEFLGVMNQGGFDVIVGNPPYVETSDLEHAYPVRSATTEQTGNLFAICLERFLALQKPAARFGVIVPISAVCTPRMLPLMHCLLRECATLCASNYAVRPAKLFVGVDMNLTIFVGQKRGEPAEDAAVLYSTRYQRWHTDFRPHLFSTLVYQPTEFHERLASVVKIGSATEARLLQKILRFGPLREVVAKRTGTEVLYYHSGGRYFKKCLRERLSNEYKEFAVEQGTGDMVICLLSSSLYYWFWIVVSDCYHVTKRDLHAFPVPNTLVEDERFPKMADALQKSMWRNATKRTRTRADGGRQDEVNFDMAKSKPLIDEIDRILGEHYWFTAEEIDHVMNYDAKYRCDARER